MKCRICKETIPEARLKSVDTDLCVKCAEKNPKPIRKAELRIDPNAAYPRGW